MLPMIVLLILEKSSPKHLSLLDMRWQRRLYFIIWASMEPGEKLWEIKNNVIGWNSDDDCFSHSREIVSKTSVFVGCEMATKALLYHMSICGAGYLWPGEKLWEIKINVLGWNSADDCCSYHYREIESRTSVFVGCEMATKALLCAPMNCNFSICSQCVCTLFGAYFPIW